MTNAVLDRELDALRDEMGLREGQKAELLRELALMASWLVAQARAGRTIEARGPDGVEVFRHPALSPSGMTRIVLSAGETERLAQILDEDAPMSEALQATLRRLSDPARQPPDVKWPDR